MPQRTCKITNVPSSRALVAIDIGTENGIERQNAEDIVRIFRDDRYINASIRLNVLYVDALYPKVTVDCKAPNEKSQPLTYNLDII